MYYSYHICYSPPIETEGRDAVDNREQLIRSALDKLTGEEIRALGLSRITSEPPNKPRSTQGFSSGPSDPDAYARESWEKTKRYMDQGGDDRPGPLRWVLDTR